MSFRTRLGPLAERNFRLLFLGRTVSLLGSAIAPVALAFAVLDDLDGSATDLGLVIAASSIAQVVFLVIGGVWADRLRRDVVLIGTDLAMFAAQGLVAALLLGGTAEVWHLAALQVLRGTAQAFFFPASTGIVPQTVTPAHLQQANAVLRLSFSGTSILGAPSAAYWSRRPVPDGRWRSTQGPSWSAPSSSRCCGFRRCRSRRGTSFASFARGGTSSGRGRGSG